MSWHLWLSIAVFLGVIIAIAFELLPMVVAALLGTAILYLTGTVDSAAQSVARSVADPVLSLLAGGMVVTRCLAPTGIFPWLSDKMVRFFRGEGSRLLVSIVLLATALSAVLPNEIAVVLLAPIIIEAARRFKVELIPLMILAVFAANSAGIFTLVGDAATYIGGMAIKETFTSYLQQVSIVAILAVLTLIALLPRVFPGIWNTRLKLSEPDQTSRPHISRPLILCTLLGITGLMILSFVIGDWLPIKIAPQLLCLSFAAMALAVTHVSRMDRAERVIADIDWHTIVFLLAIFVLVQGLESSGSITLFATMMAKTLGHSLIAANLTILAAVGLFSGFVPNAPLMATMAPIMKQYVISAGYTTPQLLAQGASALPLSIRIFFYTMIFGVTLGGNLTLLGSTANIVAGGICTKTGSPVSFAKFLRYGIPVTACQLAVSALFIIARLWRW